MIPKMFPKIFSDFSLVELYHPCVGRGNVKQFTLGEPFSGTGDVIGPAHSLTSTIAPLSYMDDEQKRVLL